MAAHMKLKRDARTLKLKALCSLRRAVTVFNGCDDDGRVTTVLLHLQHASEMLLKAVLVQSGVQVMDPAKKKVRPLDLRGRAGAPCPRPGRRASG
jgi:hypothetical protein